MRTVRVKHLAEVRYGLGQPPPAAVDGVPILRATNIERGRINPQGLVYASLKDLPLNRAPLLEEGEILIVRSGAYTGDSALITGEWAGSAPGYDLRLTPQSIDARFLAYQMLGSRVFDQIELAKSRAAQPHLNAEDLGDIEVTMSTREEERAIADYLDAEVSQIDALVETRRRSIDLARERFESGIWWATTKGLVPTPTRDSHVKWVGTIPTHWTTPSIGHVFGVQLGKMLNPEATDSGEMFPYLRNENVQWDRIDLAGLGHMHFDAADRSRYRLLPGDLLVCEGGEVGRSAIWSGELSPCYYQKALHRVRGTRSARTRFLMYVLRAAARRGVFAIEGNTSTIVHLTSEKLRAHRIPCPPPDEQDKIVQELDGHSATLKKLELAIGRQMKLLAERRVALITAAVNGEIKIPGVRA